MRRVGFLVRKEFQELRRNPRMFPVIFVAPVCWSPIIRFTHTLATFTSSVFAPAFSAPVRFTRKAAVMVLTWSLRVAEATSKLPAGSAAVSSAVS